MKNYITPPGLEKLRAELNHLRNVERPKLVETVAWAASNGDRSENADYIYGKRRLRDIDSRLRFLTQRIEAAEVVDPTKQSGKIIRFGAIVEVEDSEGTIAKYQILGEDEHQPDKGIISWRSPFASALLGKQEGDEVTVQKPMGPEVFSVLEVSYPRLKD